MSDTTTEQIEQTITQYGRACIEFGADRTDEKHKTVVSEFERLASRIRAESKRVAMCPRPINTADDDSAAWCVMTGNCGCDHAYKLCARGRHVAYALRKGGSIIGLRELDWSPDSWELRECEIVPLFDGPVSDVGNKP